jgi:hypothetical protein
MTASSGREGVVPKLWAAGLAAALIAGAVLRLIWPADIEFKLDERWMFARAQNVGVSEPWPWLGLPSSAVISNPGMNVWVFVVLRRLFNASSPPALARAVQILNIGAIVILVWFALRLVDETEREPWLWAAALGAVNPMAVLFQRKIWPPCTLPILTLVMLIAWWRRDRRDCSFVWGLVGASLGQIQIAGFFFAAAFALWTAIYQRSTARWKAWFAGSLLGSLPMLPWLLYLRRQASRHRVFPGRVSHVFEFSFWTRWVTEPFGLGMSYSLGGNYRGFLAGPSIAGVHTWMVLLIHLLLIACAGLILTRWLRMKRDAAPALNSYNSSTALAVNAAFVGFGVLLTLSTLPIHRYYLIVTFPLEFLWVARLALAPDRSTPRAQTGRALLGTLCVGQAVLSLCFLAFIHTNSGAPKGDYGLSYAAQLMRGAQPK